MPWVFWYWDDAAVSREGIRLDLEAMKQQDIGEAYLFFIRGASDPPVFSPPAVQLTEHWWDLVRFAFAEAERLDIKLGLHACDGFTTAGGPWISPDKSMKKLVWSDTLVQGPKTWTGPLIQPETLEGFYRDIRTYAYRINPRQTLSNFGLKPRITSSLPDPDLSWMNDPENTDGRFRSEDPCWLQFAFERPFTCRSVTLKGAGNIFQANRLILETSDDGEHFTFHTRLEPHRQGWADGQSDITHAIPAATARFFRFRYDPDGTEPGAEDLDAAKWRQTLKIQGIKLSSEAKIHQFEGKNGSIWRIAGHSSDDLIRPEDCIRPDSIIDLTARMTADGRLRWDIPPGAWRIRRIGYTSTGKTNYIGGGAKGLECDKFDPAVAALQFDQWVGAFYDKIPSESIEKTLEIFHVDSWECGSQNWSDAFAEEFRQRRGYDLLPNLLVMTGVPVQSADFSEQVLLDVRETIGELVRDNFFGTFKKMAAEKGLKFSAESIAPVMVGDGMLHHSIVDLPMGEFWYNSPTHDKPNDILDAISGGHIYGKKIIQSESFTEIRLDWDEHPGKLKRVLDRNFALGINRIVVHVFNHNPWVDRKPGMTLGVVGFFYQPAQTWFETGGKAWMDYIRHCQQLLQRGNPVVDIAVFTGEEMPRRAVLPDRLVQVLPGIFGDSIVEREKIRLDNQGIPMQERPAGVRSVANMADPADWINPLNGYAYDSFNKDALLRLSRVRDGKIVLPGGAAYSLLVVPGARKMMPEGDRMSLEAARKILELVKGGATVYLQQKPVRLLGPAGEKDQVVFRRVIDTLFAGAAGNGLAVRGIGKGKVITGPFTAASLAPFGVEKDLAITDENGQTVRDIAWNHRRDDDRDIYFISNPGDNTRTLNFSFRIEGKSPALYDPDQDRFFAISDWHKNGDRIELPVRLHADESCFVVFDRQAHKEPAFEQHWPGYQVIQTLDGPWEVQFDPAWGGPNEPLEFKSLTDWTDHPLDEVRYYSGTAVYKKTFIWNGSKDRNTRYYLSLGEVRNLARVKVNGARCGVAWTAPYRVDITDQLVKGTNQLEIAVSNTWANRLIGDHKLDEKDRITWTTAAYRLEGRELLPAGLLGPVVIGEW
ncbi:MAG TPA: glycosyl hydrolase [Flavilitoribacter sp.]|nr:glycosyl hydrolase [Flavilitoribacter sp.]